MFTPDMFIRPDGTNMDPYEISEMLKDWEEAPAPTTKIPDLTVERYERVPIYDARVGVLHRGTLETAPAVYRYRDIPIYKDDVQALIFKKIDNAVMKGIVEVDVALGLDLFLTLEYQMMQSTLYRSSGIHNRELSFNTSAGNVKVFASEEMGSIYLIALDRRNISRLL